MEYWVWIYGQTGHFTAFVTPGAGPHPKALSGRVISAIWWLFALILLACYFSNFNSMFHANNKHMSINTFEDLANQNVIDYGTLENGSTMMFFKVFSVAPRCWSQVTENISFFPPGTNACCVSFSFSEFQQPRSPTYLPANGAEEEFRAHHGGGCSSHPGRKLRLHW